MTHQFGRHLDHDILSPLPDVRLEKFFTTPFKNAVATAKTCYASKGIVRDEKINLTPDELGHASRDTQIAKSIYEAGHHTTLQHATFQFSLSGVSRQFIWSFLHAHPFYNSEQVSQRYVEVKHENFFVPKLTGEALSVYQAALHTQMSAYRELCRLLTPPAAREFYNRFPARAKQSEKYAKEIQKKSQEVARYVLPVATTAYLYHTVSGLTLLRYYKMMNTFDCPTEQKVVIGKMVELLLEHDENYRLVLESPMELEETPEYKFLLAHHENLTAKVRRSFIDEFDKSLDGKLSRLIDWKANGETVLAASVREVFGLSQNELSDADAIELALNPKLNTELGASLVSTTHSKLSRALVHNHYSFRKKLSHTADSQDQRHRMTPASRPVLAAHFSDEPDFITPELVKLDAASERIYTETMSRSWEAIAKLRRLGVSDEWAMYLLPNAVSVRFTESADLLNLHHKMQMRLCYNAQEEIWRASLDEAMAIRERHPSIGKYLLPPCTIRHIAGIRPTCPEGERYCGIKVWRLELNEYQRTI